jgi:hypothetical protein
MRGLDSLAFTTLVRKRKIHLYRISEESKGELLPSRRTYDGRGERSYRTIHNGKLNRSKAVPEDASPNESQMKSPRAARFELPT